MLRQKIACRGIPLFILLTISMVIAGQARQIELKDEEITIQMTDQPLITVFARLMFKYDVAIGFEESELDRDHIHYEFETDVPPDDLKPKYSGDKEYSGGIIKPREHLITLDFKNAKLETVMNEIVRQMQHYDWKISNDVVNIFPTRGRDKRLKKLLEINVRDFAVGAGSEVGTIQPKLMFILPEFKKFLAENNLGSDARRQTFAFTSSILREGMSFRDLTFKELLNAITKSKRGGWILRIKKQKDQPGQEFVEILI